MRINPISCLHSTAKTTLSLTCLFSYGYFVWKPLTDYHYSLKFHVKLELEEVCENISLRRFWVMTGRYFKICKRWQLPKISEEWNSIFLSLNYREWLEHTIERTLKREFMRTRRHKKSFGRGFKISQQWGLVLNLVLNGQSDLMAAPGFQGPLNAITCLHRPEEIFECHIVVPEN